MCCPDRYRYPRSMERGSIENTLKRYLRFSSSWVSTCRLHETIMMGVCGHEIMRWVRGREGRGGDDKKCYQRGLLESAKVEEEQNKGGDWKPNHQTVLILQLFLCVSYCFFFFFFCSTVFHLIPCRVVVVVAVERCLMTTGCCFCYFFPTFANVSLKVDCEPFVKRFAMKL